MDRSNDRPTLATEAKPTWTCPYAKEWKNLRFFPDTSTGCRFAQALVDPLAPRFAAVRLSALRLAPTAFSSSLPSARFTARPCPPFEGSNPQHPFCPSCPSPLRLQARAQGGIHESFTVGARCPWYSHRFGYGAGLRRTERQDYEQADGTINISCNASWFLFSGYAASIVLAVRSPGFRPGGGHGSRSMDRQRRGPAPAPR